MPKKLTLARVAMMARAKDPETWDRLSREEQLAWVEQLNEEARSGRDEMDAAAAAKVKAMVRASGWKRKKR